MVSKTNAITPQWLTLQQAATYVGVSQKTLENWERQGCFQVARVIAPGKTKGRALVDRDELDGYIRQFIGAPPAVIPMNAQKRRAAR